MIVSDSPPVWPGTHAEYTSAVSMKLPPAAAYWSSTANASRSFAVQPKTLPPRQSGKTLKLVPSIRRMVIRHRDRQDERRRATTGTGHYFQPLDLRVNRAGNAGLLSRAGSGSPDAILI